MLTFNKKKLLDGYIARFGPLTNDLADAFAFLFGKIENDNRFNDTDADRRKLAYCLATFKWETAHTMRPIDERDFPRAARHVSKPVSAARLQH